MEICNMINQLQSLPDKNAALECKCEKQKLIARQGKQSCPGTMSSSPAAWHQGPSSGSSLSSEETDESAEDEVRTCFTGTKVLAYWYKSTNTDT
jgi:hypothetical protein